MGRLVASIAALLLVVGQASVASAAAEDTPIPIKASMPSCVVPAKATKVAKAAARVTRCDTNNHKRRSGAAPLVFSGAAIGGIIAIALDTNTDNNTPASP